MKSNWVLYLSTEIYFAQFSLIFQSNNLFFFTFRNNTGLLPHLNIFEMNYKNQKQKKTDLFSYRC